MKCKKADIKLDFFDRLVLMWQLFLWGVDTQNKLADDEYIFDLEELEYVKSMVEIHRLASYKIEIFACDTPATWLDKWSWRIHTYIWTQCSGELIDAARKRSARTT